MSLRGVSVWYLLKWIKWLLSASSILFIKYLKRTTSSIEAIYLNNHKMPTFCTATLRSHKSIGLYKLFITKANLRIKLNPQSSIVSHKMKLEFCITNYGKLARKPDFQKKRISLRTYLLTWFLQCIRKFYLWPKASYKGPISSHF